MNFDLEKLLRDWPHEPGKIKVRKITGDDGRQKIQLRIELGVLQMNVTGRPDGKRPHGCESLLVWHQRRAREKAAKGEEYLLDEEACSELQSEGVQYYHRYVSLFQLDDFEAVVKDTQRNLDLFTFITEHSDQKDIALSVEQFRPYVLMMHTRARAALEIGRDNLNAALAEIDTGCAAIAEAYHNLDNPELADSNPELAFLEQWRDELKASRPLSQLEALEHEMEMAIAAEAYERAAELRDRIRAWKRTQGKRAK